MSSVSLIDGDILVYRTGFAGQQTLWSAFLQGEPVVQDAKNITELRNLIHEKGLAEQDLEVRSELFLDNLGHVFHSLDQQMRSICKLSGAKTHRVFLTGAGNYRELIAKTQPYKGNRADFVKPEYYEEIRGRLVKRWGAEVVQGAEADDYLAIELTGNRDAVVCSIDKDLRQVPGKHLNWTKEPAPVQVLDVDANHWLFVQAVAGDPTDNIPGISGVGVAKAAKALEGMQGSTFEEYYQAALDKYQLVYGDDGQFRLNETLALVYLCRTQKELHLAQQAASEGNTWIPSSFTAQAEAAVPAVPAGDRRRRGHPRPQPRQWARSSRPS